MEEQIPDYVIEALAEVRETGQVNMFDRRGVIEIAELIGYVSPAQWLEKNRDRYMEALNAMGAARKAGA